MYVIVPIPRLVIDKSIKLGEIFFTSIMALSFNDNLITDNQDYKSIMLKIQEIWESYPGSSSIGIYRIEELRSDLCDEDLVDELIRPVDMALDCIRLSLNSFQFHEQIIGMPGFYQGIMTVITVDNNLTNYEIVTGKNLYYSLLEGIGCDAQGCTDYQEYEKLLLSNRSDEVFKKYRKILHRVCEAMQIYDVDNCFAFLFSTIEGMDCTDSYKFQSKKIRILSFIVSNQHEFDVLSQQFYFYSKVIRTEVIHSGKILFNLLPWNKVYRMLDDLYILIVRFCITVIESNVLSFEELNNKITEKQELFQYNSPLVNISIKEMQYTSIDKCDYYGEINNIDIKQCLKLGETILVPKNAKSYIKELNEMYIYGLGICYSNNIDEKDIKINSDFPYYEQLLDKFNIHDRAFTVYDIDTILTSLYHIKTDEAFAILQNQPYLSPTTDKFNTDYYFRFADIICNAIQKAFSYLILIMPDLNNNVMPSRVGINSSGIRFAYINPPKSNSIYDIPGRIFDEYQEPPFPYTPNFLGGSEILYNCLYGKRTDEVFLTNNAALHRLAECMYFSNIEHQLLSVFDVMDMLYPNAFDGEKLIKRVAIFYSDTIEEKDKIVNELKTYRSNLRNPLFHGGKSIIELPYDKSDIVNIIDNIKHIIIRYCENVYKLNVVTFEELKNKQTAKFKELK